MKPLTTGALAMVVGALLLGMLAPGTMAATSQLPGTALPTSGRTTAHWAHAQRAALVRRRPNVVARSVARLRFDTEDGYPEVYKAMRRARDADGAPWILVGVPMRPNGTKGWVRESALGPIYRVRTRLVVNRARLRATLYRAGRAVWSSPIGVGAAATPTPPGEFWVREKFVVAEAGGPYGTRAIGTSNYSVLSDWPGGGVIGIHGTNEPGLIPGRPSHGCVRVRNDAVESLYDLLPIGTPVDVLR